MSDPILSKVYNQEMPSSAPIKLAAVIVETRKLRNLAEIIDSHLAKLPYYCRLVVVTTGECKEYLHDKLNYPDAVFEAIDWRIISDFSSTHHYNKLLTSPEFWESLLMYEKILVFQHDSEMLRTGIEEYYQYDYIGADWRWNPYHPGNGGASLRTPSVMLEVCKRFPWDGHLNEDHWITDKMFHHKIGRLATKEEARTFSVEAVFSLGTLMSHAPEKWLSAEECWKIKNQYKPEVIG